MTSITENNFKEIFPQFVRDLGQASYIALDFEFTGITRTAEQKDNFLRSPEEAFREKMESANRYSLLQMGVSVFFGDDGLNDCEGVSEGETVTSEGFQKRMNAEAESFCTVSPSAKQSTSMHCSTASYGTVRDDDILELEKAREGVTRPTEGAAAKDEYVHKYNDNDYSKARELAAEERIRSLHAVDEANDAVSLALRRQSEVDQSRKHLLTKNYSCYLIPHSSATSERDICISAETVKFLRRNEMDFNKWIDESLQFVMLEEYLTARRAALTGTGEPAGTPALDAGIAAIHSWTHTVLQGNKLFDVDRVMWGVEQFVRNGEVGDTMETDFPFLPVDFFLALTNLLRVIGLELRNRHLRIVSRVDSDENTKNDEDARYFGTRLLYALISVSRHKNKPIIVHNGAMDFAFLLSTLFGPINSLKEFKRAVRKNFPVFFDTRALTCAPSLQHISYLTGPLKRTCKAINEVEDGVRFYDGSYSNEITINALPEHNAVSDSLMSGVLFALVRNVLAKNGADFRLLRCITPLHGCIFSIFYESDEFDCLVQVKNAPVFQIKRPANLLLNPDRLRKKLMGHLRNVFFLFSGENCLLIGGEKVDSMKSCELHEILKQWATQVGASVTPLKVDARCSELKLRYISELAS